MPKVLSYLFLFLFTLGAYADDDYEPAQQVQQILNSKEIPAGIVFEIVMADEDGLRWAIPQTNDYIKQLRQHFPELSIAIVTHGREQFALETAGNKSYTEIHKTVSSLTQEQNIPVHVCGTHAGWRGKTDEDFPDYVDVAAAGPAQVNDYVALGYIKIIITSDEMW